MSEKVYMVSLRAEDLAGHCVSLPAVYNRINRFVRNALGHLEQMIDGDSGLIPFLHETL